MWLGAPRELKVDVHLWFVVQGSTAQPMKVENQEILWSHPASNQLVFVFLQKEDTRDLLGRSLKLKQLNKVKNVKMPLMRLTFKSLFDLRVLTHASSFPNETVGFSECGGLAQCTAIVGQLLTIQDDRLCSCTCASQFTKQFHANYIITLQPYSCLGLEAGGRQWALPLSLPCFYKRGRWVSGEFRSVPRLYC